VNGFMPDFELTPSKGKLGDWNFFLKPSKNRTFFTMLVIPSIYLLLAKENVDSKAG
jgi:hypothetical protein